MVLGLDFSEIEYPEHYPDDADLVGYWDFDGDDHTTNLTLDSSGNNNTGTCVNMSGYICNWTVGKVGTGMLFDGVNDYINAGDSPFDITDRLTLSAWVYMTAHSQTSIIAKDFGDDTTPYVLRDTAGGFNEWWFYAYTTAGNVLFGCRTPDGSAVLITWTLLVATFDKDLDTKNAKLYMNGVLENTSDYTSALNTNDEPLKIGSYSGTYFPGTLDEVAIYSRALNQSKIMRHYELGFKRIKDESAVYCDNCSRMHNNFAVFPSDFANVSARLPAADPDLTAEGKHGSAMVFDGVDDYVDCGNDSSLNLTDNFTIEAWIYPLTPDNDASGFDAIVSNDDGVQRKYYFAIDDFTSGANKIMFICDAGNDCGTSDSNISYNAWLHVAVVYKSGDQKYTSMVF